VTLDVLVTILPSTPSAWVETALASVSEAAREAPFTVNTIRVPGVPGHVGQAMMDGLQLSTAEYVAWVDDDDWVLPRAFSVLTDALAQQPIAVCAREMWVYANGYETPFTERHHLTAWNSPWAKAQDLSLFRATPLLCLLKRLPSDVIDVYDTVYMHRKRRSPAQALRKAHAAAESQLWL
jgi:hypothetical protein